MGRGTRPKQEDFIEKKNTRQIESRDRSTVLHSGLVVNPGIPYLGATPDGKVIDKSHNDKYGLLEIKCPYKFRNVSIQEAVLDKSFCMEQIDDKIRLKRNHCYFYQIQGQMALSGLKWCDFVVYTFQSIFVERIAFEEDIWADVMLPCLTKFYFEHALPYLQR